MEARIDAINEKFKVPQHILVSRIDIYQARIESAQEDMKAKRRWGS
jgi:hypothetical protein